MANRGDQSESHLRSALQAHQAGRLPDAERLYRLVLEQRPAEATAMTNLGIIYAQAGRLYEAVNQFQECVRVDPKSAVARTYLGHALRDCERLEEAIIQYGEAVLLEPGSASGFFVLGNALLKVDRPSEALEAFGHSVRLDAKNPDAWMNRGLALYRAGDFEEAVRSHRRSLDLNPRSASAWLNLGDACLGSKRFEAAVSAYENGLKISPQDWDGWVGLSDALSGLARYPEAHRAIERSLKLNPDIPRSLFVRARIWQCQKLSDLAVQGYRDVINKEPEQVSARFNLAMLLTEQGRHEEARTEYKRVAETPGCPLAVASEVRAALVVPVIAESAKQIELARLRIRQELTILMCEGLILDDPQSQVGTPGFYLAYQGRNNAELMGGISRLLTTIVPDLAWVAPHLKIEISVPARLKLAFISAHLREHTVGRINAGLIQQLDRSQFEVFVMRPFGSADSYSAEIDQYADRVVELPDDFRAARLEVAKSELDIIYYPDLGMEPFTYYLAHSRLARVQCAGWGHADTSGIENVDCYISSRDFEPEDGQAYYTETLLPLSRINNYYPKLPSEYATISRQEIGLPDGGAIYLCPQSSFKFHPEFDEALGEILRLDPTGIVALSSGTEGHWDELLRARFDKSIHDVSERVIFLSRIRPEKFRGLLALADVIIDPKHFTGGHTIYMAFSVGTPVVTWNGSRMSGRMTQGLYKQMGMQGPVAQDAHEFGEMAVRIAKDRTYREALSVEIREKSDFLFEDHNAVREFERALQAVYSVNGLGVRGYHGGHPKKPD